MSRIEKSAAAKAYFRGSIHMRLSRVPHWNEKIKPANENIFSPEELNSQLALLLEGGILNWSSRNIAEDYTREMARVPNILNTIINTFANSELSPQSFDLITNTIEETSLNNEYLGSQQMVRYFTASKLAIELLAASAANPQTAEVFESSQKLKAAFAARAKTATISVGQLQPKDLANYIKFSDYQYLISSIFEEKVVSIVLDAVNLVFEDGNLSLINDRFNKINRQAWDRLRNNWGQEQVNEALDIIPKITQPVVLLNVLAALESNLGNLKNDGEIEPFFPPDPETIVILLKNSWHFSKENSQFLKDNIDSFSEFLDYLNMPEQIGDANIPRKYLPSLAIAYFQAISQFAPAEIILNTIQEVGSLTQADPQLRTKWFITLLSLQTKFAYIPKLSQEVERWEPKDRPQIGQVLKDERPGKLWLTTEGKLRITDNRSKISAGFLIHESKIREPQFEPPVPIEVIAQTPKIPENQLETEVNTYDFVGAIGIMEDEKVVEYLEKQKAGRIFAEDAIGLKIMELQEEFKMPKDEQTLIFHYPLNSQDEPIKEAKKLGIETIVISGNVVTFVLDKDTKDAPYSTNGEKKIPTAFTATLDEDGWLTLDAQEEQNYLTLTLNMIVLELAAKRPQEEQALTQLRAETKPALDEWNRNNRGSLPRLNTNLSTETDVLIAVKTNGQTVFTSVS